ncbi:hypothetical protein AAFF_G00113370 [Aldrovandia affinis]|uniref:Uncharacterized protein n=1 Tax=Aldrovandia affinis TaxID=143900 RepID=A0AAD7RTH5_9TELE|nr:hypothetical protein AAFF_G00113370 [Aldrovandia affinis]
MAIKRFCAAGAITPSFVIQNATQRPDKVTARKATRYSPPGGKRNYTTAYRENFCRWDGVLRRKPFRPVDNLTLSDARFQGTTSYQTDYGPKAYAGMQGVCAAEWITPARPGPKVPKYQSFQAVARSTPQYAPEAPQRPSKLQGVLYNPNPTTSTRYARYAQALRIAQGDGPDLPQTPKTAKENIRLKPTEYGDSCKICPTPPVYQRQNLPYDSPKHMQFLTSYTCDYRPWGLQTRPAIRQLDEFVRPTGPFQHSTSYLSEYRLKVATTSRKPTQRR